VQLAEKVKKSKLEKSAKRPALVNKKVVKISKRKLKESTEMAFQGQKADAAGDGDGQAKKPKRKKNRTELKKKMLAKKFADA
jgi:hypothetical protein